MQPGIGNDILEIYLRGKGAYRDSQERGAEQAKQNRLMEIGGMAGRGDLTGASNLALTGGDFGTANNLMQIADGRKKSDRERVEHIAGVLYSADTPDKWQQAIQYLKANGEEIDPEEEDFNNREAIVSQAMSLKDQLAGKRADREFEANQDYRSQSLAIERAKLAGGGAKPPSGYRVSADGQGLEPIPGGPADPNKRVPVRNLRPTGEQNTAAGFYDRMVDAEKVLSDPAVTTAATSYAGKAKANAPFGIGNYLATPDYQRFDQAQRNFVNAVLRKESGAVISESEFDNAAKQYFPQPGDGPEKLALKAQNRATAINAMKRTAAAALSQGGQQQDMGQAEPGEIPSDAIGELLADPSGAAEFDEIFGAGAAQQILENQ